MKNTNISQLLGKFLLLIATLAWGSSFFILKDTIATVPMFFVLTIRFFISGIVLGIIFFKQLIKLSKKMIMQGIVLGITLALAYVIQTIGLTYTTPSRNAFLSGSYAVMTPFLYWFFSKKAPKLYSVVSAVLCVVGIGFISLTDNVIGELFYLFGDGLSLISAIFYALQIIYIDMYRGEQKYDSMCLLAIELLTVGVINGILSLIFELPKGVEIYAMNLDQILNICYLTGICTLVAQFCLMFGQKLTTVNQASLILSLEAVFGAFFSVLFGREVLTGKLITGFIIVFVAMLINELKVDVLKPFKKIKNK